MAELALNPQEEQILEQVVRRCVADLELEILHTDNSQFRSMLQERRRILERIHERLQHELPAAV